MNRFIFVVLFFTNITGFVPTFARLCGKFMCFLLVFIMMNVLGFTLYLLKINNVLFNVSCDCSYEFSRFWLCLRNIVELPNYLALRSSENKQFEFLLPPKIFFDDFSELFCVCFSLQVAIKIVKKKLEQSLEINFSHLICNQQISW